MHTINFETADGDTAGVSIFGFLGGGTGGKEEERTMGASGRGTGVGATR